jgi:hypothetical protein
MGVIGVAGERVGIERRGIDIHAVARPEHVSEDEAHHQRHRRHHFEINQRLDADPPDFFQVAGAGDAMDHHAEHDRRHDHRDQFQEGVAEDLEADREIGDGHAEHDPQQQRYQDLDEQRGIEWLSDGRCCGCYGGH